MKLSWSFQATPFVQTKKLHDTRGVPIKKFKIRPRVSYQASKTRTFVSKVNGDAAVIAESLREFRGVEHRIEFTRELDGVRWYNDSKGTNVDSTIRAVQTMTRPTVIILGGSDKHCDFTPLAQEMLASPWIREAVLIGVTAPQIEAALQRQGWTHIHHAASMAEAVEQCRVIAQPGWNALLSPACASFDMFSDYEDRGRKFKALVAALH